MSQPDIGRRVTPQQEAAIERALALAFAPLHKRAFGIAIGSAVGILIFAATAVQYVRGPIDGPGLWLLREYFFGYDVSWRGAFVGLGWGFVTGFVAGWFVAFCRNLVIAITVFITRTRAELGATRDFLDHI